MTDVQVTEVKTKPLLTGYVVKITKDPMGYVVAAEATMPYDRKITIPVAYVAWGDTVKTLRDMAKAHQISYTGDHFIKMIKTFRREFNLGLFDAKQVCDLLVEKEGKLIDGSIVVRISQYEESIITFEEMQKAASQQ